MAVVTTFAANGTYDLGAPIPATGLLYLLGIGIAVLILTYMIYTLFEHSEEKWQEKP